MGTATTLSNADIKETAHILIHLLGDPELVRYFLRIYITIERDHLLELARSFHTSLRLKPSDRWSRLNDLCEKKDFSKISPNSALPITCSLPIDGKRWRAQKEVLTAIDYMRGNFIRCVEPGFLQTKDDKTKFSEKVKLLNHSCCLDKDITTEHLGLPVFQLSLKMDLQSPPNRNLGLVQGWESVC